MENFDVTFQKAVLKKNMESIRDILAGSITMDQGFSKGILEDNLRYCLDNGILDNELFVKFDGDTLNENITDWDIHYYASQRTKLRNNFSLERLEHLKKVGRKLFPSAEPASSHAYEEAQRGNYRLGQGPGKQKGDFPKWLIPVGIGAAAIILLWILFA